MERENIKGRIRFAVGLAELRSAVEAAYAATSPKKTWSQASTIRMVSLGGRVAISACSGELAVARDIHPLDGGIAAEDGELRADSFAFYAMADALRAAVQGLWKATPAKERGDAIVNVSVIGECDGSDSLELDAGAASAAVKPFNGQVSSVAKIIDGAFGGADGSPSLTIGVGVLERLAAAAKAAGGESVTILVPTSTKNGEITRALPFRVGRGDSPMETGVFAPMRTF